MSALSDRQALDSQLALAKGNPHAVEVLGWIGDDDQPPHSNVDMAWKAREIVDTLRAVLDGEDFYGDPSGMLAAYRHAAAGGFEDPNA